MGGPAYKRVRDRVEDQFSLYWSPTGTSGDAKTEARERVEEAEIAVRDAAHRLAGLERTFSDLEVARSRLKLIQREIADDTDAQVRKDLMASLEVARAAAQILETRKADMRLLAHGCEVSTTSSDRHSKAIEDRDKAQCALDRMREQRAELADPRRGEGQRLVDMRMCSSGRDVRQDARTALSAGEDRASSCATEDSGRRRRANAMRTC